MGCQESCGCEPACDGGCGCDSCDDNCCFCNFVEGISLSDSLGVCKNSGWQVGGWSAFGYTNNNVPLSQAYNDLLSFNNVPDRLHLNQQWIYFGKAADGSCGLDVGARVDVLYGTDAQKTQAFGNPNAGIRNEGSFDASWDHSSYGWAMPQLYAEVAINDLSVKIGHFFSIQGYKVVQANANFFYTHSYSMFNTKPFTHTGALATYKPCGDEVTYYGGWTLGWDTGFDQLNQGNTFLGGIGRKLSDDVTLTYALTYGNFGWRDGGSDNSYSHSIVLDVALTERLKFVAQSDLLRTDNPGISNFDVFSLVNYLFYTVNDKVSAGIRVEWWKADGISFNEITGGVNIKPCKNLVFRPEIRQDWAPGIGLDESTFGIDMVLTY